MSNIYKNPDLPGADNSVLFTRVGDRVRGRVMSVEVVTTKYGQRLKFRLDPGTGKSVTLVAGAKNLSAQIIALEPGLGDILSVELIELRPSQSGTAKLFTVEVEPGSSMAALSAQSDNFAPDATFSAAPSITQPLPPPPQWPPAQPVLPERIAPVADILGTRGLKPATPAGQDGLGDWNFDMGQAPQ